MTILSMASPAVSKNVTHAQGNMGIHVSQCYGYPRAPEGRPNVVVSHPRGGVTQTTTAGRANNAQPAVVPCHTCSEHH